MKLLILAAFLLAAWYVLRYALSDDERFTLRAFEAASEDSGGW